MGVIDLLPSSVFLWTTALKGSAVLLVAWGSVRLLKPRSAALRHLVWALALVALVVLPALSLVLPSWRALPAALTVERWSAPVGAVAAERTPALPEPALAPTTFDALASDITEVRAGQAFAELEAPADAVPSVAEANGVGSAAMPPSDAVPPSATGSSRLELLLSSLSLDRLWGPLTWLTWLAGFGGWMLWSLVGLLRVHRIGRTASSVVPARWRRDLDEARETLRVGRSVRLLRSDRVTVPVTWGLGRPVVVLPVAAGSWSDEQVRQALLHEVAHIARLDQPLLIVAQWACALHWFNPLAWFGLRELQRNCERATDDRVLASGVRASDYAASLVAVARGIRPGSGLPAAAFAMARTSELGGRVDAILDSARSRRGATRFDVLAVVIISAGFLTPLAALSARSDGPTPPSAPSSVSRLEAPDIPEPPYPGEHVNLEPHDFEASLHESEGLLAEAQALLTDLQADLDKDLTRLAAVSPMEILSPAGQAQEFPCFDRDRRITGDQIEVNDSGMRAYWRTADCTWTLRVDGEVHFTPDERGVQSLTPGGSMLLLQEGLGPDRRYRVTESSGDFEIDYQVGGSDRPLQEADAWLRLAIPELHRVTGIDRDVRIARILERGGVEALLQEVALIRSGYETRLYLEAVLRTGDPSPAEVAEILWVAEDRIDSDYEMRKLLTAAQFDLRSEDVREAYMDAAGSIESDYELRTALEGFLVGEVSPEEAEVVLSLAEHVRSDFELRELMQRAAREAELSEERIAFFLDVVAGIESDFEMREAVRSVFDQPALEDDHLVDFMDRIEDMDSDFERAELLRAIVRLRAPLSAALADRVTEALDAFDSKYERERVESALRQGAR